MGALLPVWVVRAGASGLLLSALLLPSWVLRYSPSSAPVAARPPMVRVPVGTFRMGADKDPPAAGHDVTLTVPFAIATTEVTQAEYEAVMGENPSYFKGADRPVEQVSWLNAVTYCNRLSDVEGLERCYEISGTDVRWQGPRCLGYRLPTEAEWEYAARADSQTAFSGSDVEDEVAWTNNNAGGQTHPVGQRKPNNWQLHDMSGNVWEWIWDWYGGEQATSPDPRGPATGQERVVRGGSWASGIAQVHRVAHRNRFPPDIRITYIGFRPVKSSPPKPPPAKVRVLLRSDPPNAEVYLQGQATMLGSTNQSGLPFELYLGQTLELRVRKAAYMDFPLRLDQSHAPVHLIKLTPAP